MPYTISDLDKALVGCDEIAAAVYCTDQPSESQIRQIRNWLRTGTLRASRVGQKYVSSPRLIRAQLGLDGGAEK